MKLERTKNAARNIVFDGTLEMVNMLFPFVIRSVMLHCLGTEYLGLNRDMPTIGYGALILICVQLFPLIGCVFPTERALKRTFDRFGQRIE